MITFGIVVEGPRDATVYPVIIRRIRSDVENVIARPCGGVPALLKKFGGMLRGLSYNLSRISPSISMRHDA